MIKKNNKVFRKTLLYEGLSELVFVSQNFQFNFAEFHLSLKGPLISYFSISADRSDKVFNFDEDIISLLFTAQCLEKIIVELSSGM